MTQLNKTTLSHINIYKKQYVTSKYFKFFPYTKAMAHTLHIKKSKQELTRKWQTFRKGETQNHRPKFQSIKKYGSGVAEWISSSKLAPQGIIRRGNMNTLNLFTKRLTTLFTIFLLVFIYTVSQAAEVSFSWSPNSEPTLAGYKIYYGTNPASYTSSIDVGLPEIINQNISTSLVGYIEGVTYYFGATAYDNDGLESDYSQEISWTAPNYEATDLTGDSKGDILLRNSVYGNLWLYEMDDSVISTTSSIGGLNLNWTIAGTGDFTGNGKADILLRHNDYGNLWLYEMDGNSIITNESIGGLAVNWSIAGIADFTGDSRSDILLRHNIYGNLWLYEMDGNSIVASESIGGLSLNWSIAGIADLTGDGKADILLRHNIYGNLWLYEMDRNSIVASESIGGLNFDWEISGLSDFNGDNKADILLHSATSGSLWLYEMNGNNISDSNSIDGLGVQWSIAAISDYSGDNKADILFRDQDSGDLWMYRMNSHIIEDSTNISALSQDWEVM